MKPDLATRALAMLAGCLLLACPALAQQQTIYDTAGRPAGHAATDSQGTTTYTDAAGRVTTRSSVSGTGTTTVYDAAGRRVGTVSPVKR